MRAIRKRRSAELNPGAAYRRVCHLVAGMALAVALDGTSPADEPRAGVDTALVLAVDVSGSVTSERYRLQMEGIAEAFEDEAVQRAILLGPRRSMLITLVEWSDRPRASIPWMVVAGHDDARHFAQLVRGLSRSAAEFTCLSRMLSFVGDKVLPQVPLPASRTIVDVSGDGRENCNPAVPVDTVRDELAAREVTINGLPILEGAEAETLGPWYAEHVIGGRGAFAMPAAGFADFARAIRQKFIIEISAVDRRAPLARVACRRARV
jgi:hypothetical protein